MTSNWAPAPSPPGANFEASSSSPTTPWGAWVTLGFGVVITMVMVTIQTIVTFGFILSRIGSARSDEIEGLIRNLESDGLLLSIATIVSAPICIGTILLFVKLREGPSITEYLQLTPVSIKDLSKWLGITVLVIVGIEFINSLLGVSAPDFMTDVYETAGFLPLLWIAIIVIGPLFEELFFRGFLFAGLHNSKVGAVGAVILTSFFWAFLHLQYDFYSIGTVFVFGIVLGIARLKTGSVCTPFLMHAFNNLVATILLALYIVN